MRISKWQWSVTFPSSMQQLLCPTVEVFLSWVLNSPTSKVQSLGDWEKTFCKWVIRYNNGRCHAYIHPFPDPSILTLGETAPHLSHWFRVYDASQPCKVLTANWCCNWIFDSFYFMCVMRYVVRLVSSMMIAHRLIFFFFFFAEKWVSWSRYLCRKL